MEWKRTARNIAGSLQAFPVQNRLNRSIQISVGYSFARWVMEKYQLSEDGYGSLSASFVYLDVALGQGASEAVRELIHALTVLCKLRVSVLNQSYEKNYYVAVNMRCEQMFAALEQNLSWQAEIREMKSIWQAIKKEIPGEKGREAGQQPGSRKEPENWERPGIPKEPEDWERPGSRKELEDWERPGSRKESEDWERIGNREELGNREWLRNREKLGNRENPESQESQEHQENLRYRQGQRDNVEKRLKILRDRVQTRILENAGKAGVPSFRLGSRAGEGGPRAGRGSWASSLSLTASAGFPKGGKGAGARASVLSAWKSFQARRFFWRVQRASWWEQQVVLAASGAGTLSELMNRLRPLEGEAWMRFFSRLKEQAESCMEDSEFLSRLISEAIENNIPVPYLFSSKSPKAIRDISSREPFTEKEPPAEEKAFPEESGFADEKEFSVGNGMAERSTDQGIVRKEEETKRGESRKESVPLARLKELVRLLILQEEIWTDAENQRESLTGGMGQEEMLLSLLEQGRILELLEDRKEKSWLDQARKEIFELPPGEWQAFKEELLKESGLLPAKAGHQDDDSLVSKLFPEPGRGADAEKEMILETVFKVQHFFGESMDESSGSETRDTRVGDKQPGPEIQDAPVGERLWEEIRRLRNRLTADPSVSGELAELLNEGIRRLKRRKELEDGYRAVMEAVSYLDVSQWRQLKEDLFSAESQEDERFPGTVFYWLREERQKEEEKAGKDKESDTRDGMTGEKRRFLKALMAEAENEVIPIRQKEQLFERIFTKSRVLSEYIDWDESTFQAGAWPSENPDTFQAPDGKEQDLSAVLSSLTREEWKRLIKELPVIERERLQTIDEGKEAVQSLWELFRDFPENQNREAELHHQKQRVLRFLNQSGSGREALEELLGEELRELEISGGRGSLYQSLTEAASCMTREEWKTFQREVTEGLREETEEMDTTEWGALNLRWISRSGAGNTEGAGYRKSPDGNVSGSQAVFGEENVPAGDELRELMEMSEEKQEFLKFLAGQLFLEKMPGTEERPEKNQGEEYGHWERVFKKSQVLSRYVSWEKAGTPDGKRGIDLVKDGISRLDAKQWEAFRSGMEKRLFCILLTEGEAGEGTGPKKSERIREIRTSGSGQDFPPGGLRREMYGTLTL